MDDFNKHEFRINFEFTNNEYVPSLAMIQKDHPDEHHKTPNDTMLEMEYGSQAIDNYYSRRDPLKNQHINNDYTPAVIKGIQEFLNSKHS